MNFNRKTLSFLLSWRAKHKEISEKVDKEFDAIERLSVQDACDLVMRKIEEYPQEFDVIPASDEHSEVLDDVDPTTAKLFSKYNEVYIVGVDSRIRLFVKPRLSKRQEKLLVCKCEQDDFDLFLLDGGPEVAAYKAEEEFDRFKSIYHFILISF